MSCYVRGLRSMVLPSGNFDAANYGISPSVGDNGPAWNQLVADIRGSVRGGAIWLEPGTYDFQTQPVDPGGSPIEIIGSGTDLTYLRCAGSMVTNGADFFAPKRNFRMYRLTLDSTSARTSGKFVKVVGDMLITEAPSRDMMNIAFGGVNMKRGFDGLKLEDLDGDHSVVGFFWDGDFSVARGFAPGGWVVDIDSPGGATHGGCVNKIMHIIHTETNGVSDANRPAGTVRIRGTADLRLYGIESVYARRGLVIDPPASPGRAATIFIGECIWGATTQEAVVINANATADSHTIEMVGGYVDSGGMYCGPATKGLYVSAMSFLGNTLVTGDALRLDGCSGNTFSNILFGGANTTCLRALNNAKNFKLTGAFNNVNRNMINGTGIRIDTGCDKYKVDMVGGEYCTTPLHGSNPANDSTKSASVY